MSAYGIIYKLTSPSGKIYIGQARNWRGRVSKYKNGHCQQQPKLYASIQKYGWESHGREVVENVLIADLSARERYWIAFYNSCDNGLNASMGGDDMLGFRTAHATKVKQSRARLKHDHPFALYQYALDGKFIRGFETVTDAARSISDSANTTNISACCKGKRRYAYGYQWSYVLYPEMSPIDSMVSILRTARGKPFHQLKNGEIVNTFQSQNEAQEQTGIQAKNIQKVLKGRRNHTGGFQWEYVSRNLPNVVNYEKVPF